MAFTAKLKAQIPSRVSRVRAPEEGRGNERMHFEFSLIASWQARDRGRARCVIDQLHIVKTTRNSALPLIMRA